MTNPTPQAVGDSAASTLSVFGLFAMGFGQIVGVGWIIIMGSWLAAGGPVGTMSMLLLGGVLLLSVSLCYGWISQRVREPGGEIAYAKAVFGQRVAFIIGWFIALFAIAIVSFLTISFGWVTSILLGLPKGPVL
ncbi:MAG: amino acid permease, partial [Pseudomonadota bacterium]